MKTVNGDAVNLSEPWSRPSLLPLQAGAPRRRRRRRASAPLLGAGFAPPGRCAPAAGVLERRAWEYDGGPSVSRVRQESLRIGSRLVVSTWSYNSCPLRCTRKRHVRVPAGDCRYGWIPGLGPSRFLYKDGYSSRVVRVILAQGPC